MSFQKRFLFGFNIFIFSLLLTLPVGSNGQISSMLNFNTIDVSNGLSNNKVNAIAQDDFGFMWIGTNDGLNRYDAHETIHTYRTGDIGLESDLIKALLADSNDNLWIGTSIGGLVKYNVKTDESTTYNKSSNGDMLLSSNEVLSIAEVEDEIFVGTEDGLNVLNPATDSIYQFPIGDGEGQLNAHAILSITYDDNGYLWIGTWGDHFYLYLPHPSGRHDLGKFRQFQLGEVRNTKHTWKIFQDTEDRYWVATHGGGLIAMQLPKNASNSQESQDWNPLHRQFLYEANCSPSITNNYPQDIAKDNEGNIWVTTEHGLNIIEADELEKFEFDVNHINFNNQYYIVEGQNSVSSNQMHDLYIDNQGLIWIATTAGVSLFNQRLNQFDWRFINYDLNGKPIDFDLIVTITQVDDDHILLASQTAGLHTYNIKDQELVENAASYNQFKEEAIQALHYAKASNSLYIGTIDDVYCVNPTSQKVKKCGLLDNFKKDKPNLEISAIVEDDKGQVWIGTDAGLVQFIKDTNKANWFYHDPNDKKSLSDNAITQVYKDSTGKIWIATYNGINIIEQGRDGVEFQVLKTDPNDNNSIPTNQIRSIYEYDGKIYFGSIAGLFSIDMGNSNVDHIDKSKLKYTVDGIKITDKGMLWAGTANGLLRYDINQKQSYLFTKKEAIGHLAYRSFGSILDQNNTFYIGGNKKFGIIKDVDPADYSTKSNLYITDIHVINADSENTISGLHHSKIELPPNNYYLEVSFTNLDYSQLESTQYAYRLLGFKDENWHFTDDEQVSYTNLDNGNYTFEVKSVVGDGQTPQPIKSFEITVEPSFIESIWFKLLVLGSLLLLFFVGNLVHTRNFRKRNEMLRQYNTNLNLEIEKTASANAALEEREKSMKILVEKLNKSNEDLLRSNQDLEQFAYVASHDLQEPLNTVGAFTKLLNDRLDHDEKNVQFMNYITAGVDRMSALIKSILTYSLVSSEEIELQKTDLESIIHSKVQDLNVMISNRNASVNIGKIPAIICDGDQMGMVFYNMILNGLKFNKSAEPIINVYATESKSHNIFTVEDNGIGIPEEYQNRIFDIFKRLHGKGEYEGTGIGLSLCSKIIHRHEGEITVDSAIGKGTKFIFSVSKNLKETPVPSLV